MGLRFKKDTAYREMVDALSELGDEAAFELEPTYAITKAKDEQRYTFGPLYSPGVEDAHGEWASADDLQKAIWDYVRESNFSLHKQHGEDVIGEIVEIVQWPFDLDAELCVAGEVQKFKLPAGTVYNGVIWSEDAWPLVKSGEISGLSMGGRAIRVAEPAPGVFA